MSVFFGTDGIRGIVGKDLTGENAFACGCSISQLLSGSGKVLIAKDTRNSGDFLLAEISGGLIKGGVDVVYIGVAPTACVSYLTQKFGFDFGIMLTASHNPAKYNGIKIFASDGGKLSEFQEIAIERGFIKNNDCNLKFGKFCFKPRLVSKYVKYIISCIGCDLTGKSVVLDCANGASLKVAPLIFRKLGAKVYKINCKNDGENINKDCGALHPEKLTEKVVKKKADFGFAFDGDADRVVVVDDCGKVVDGDRLIYGLALDFAENQHLNKNQVVGTVLTNMGIENALKERGISLLRANVGDKYVADMMEKKHLVLGGEKSGHIIFKDYLKTGDGILTAGIFASLCVRHGIKSSQFVDVNLFPEQSINIEVKDKYKSLKNINLKRALKQVRDKLENIGRALVRSSGTEPKIRIMVECKDEKLCRDCANYLAEIVRQGEK